MINQFSRDSNQDLIGTSITLYAPKHLKHSLFQKRSAIQLSGENHYSQLIVSLAKIPF
jgi:hypothetical protein